MFQESTQGDSPPRVASPGIFAAADDDDPAAPGANSAVDVTAPIPAQAKEHRRFSWLIDDDFKHRARRRLSLPIRATKQ